MNPTLLASATIMGFVGGTHCLTMCGGIVGLLSSGLAPQARTGRPLTYLLAYNAGRITTYAVVGASVAGVAGLARGVFPFEHAQLALRFIAVVLMVGLGLYLAGWWRSFAVVERMGLPLWKRLEPYAQRLLPVTSVVQAALLGLVWGWLPCGLVYAAIPLAFSADSWLEGGAVMMAFGIGTLPTLLTMGAFAGLVTRFVRRLWVRRAAGLAILGFAVVNLLTASAQAGWITMPGAKKHCCTTAH